MRKPLKTKSGSRGAVSKFASFPAPVGGLNDRDPLSDMPVTDALYLDNFFPKTNYIEMRGGWANHATGTTGNVKTIAVYNQMSGTNKMYAVTASGIYDATSAGAVGASVLSRTDGKHQYVNFGDGTSHYLIMVNGVDKPAYFDGTTWTAVDGATSPALTGLTTTNIINVFVSKGRLFFIGKDSLSFWYLEASAAGGALTEFVLEGVAKKGGYLMAGATWTFDGGDGIDDAVVLVTSEGEVIIYKGTNPGSASAWLLSGVFEIGKPIGRRCLQKFGNELIILTEDGAFPISSIVKNYDLDKRMAMTDKIKNSFNVAARSYNGVFGWDITVYPAQSALIINVPVAEDGEHYQYVMNTITKAWCKFTGWNAEAFAVFNEDLYFATGTTILKAWVGSIDGGSSIIAYGKTAFNYFGDNGKQKKFNLFRPVISVNGAIEYLVDVDVDFNESTISGVANNAASTAGTWNTSLWDQATWAYGQQIYKRWSSPSSGIGFCAAGKLKIATNSRTIQWLSCDYMYETGSTI